MCRQQEEMAKWPPRLIYNVSAGAEVCPFPSSQHTEDSSQLRGDICQAAWLTKQVRLHHTVDTRRHLWRPAMMGTYFKRKNGAITTLFNIQKEHCCFSEFYNKFFKDIHSKSTKQTLNQPIALVIAERNYVPTKLQWHHLHCIHGQACSHYYWSRTSKHKHWPSSLELNGVM